jgi:hypothetical protein
LFCAITLLAVGTVTWTAEVPALGTNRITQEDVESGDLSLEEIRAAGLRVFSTSFNKLDGYGDGPANSANALSPGSRPTLQGNGTFLRVNGLDGQSCFECHNQVSAATIPPTMGVGGAAGSNSNVMFMPALLESDDPDLDGTSFFNGRFINPPFVFGSGGVELVGLEMTVELQALKQQALDNPNVPVSLVTKSVGFGTIVADAFGNLDTSGVEGISEDLVVRPFGRKGCCATTRDFASGAMQFHFGMQPAEVVGDGVDDDGDGVSDEILIGELSAMHAFMATIERPFAESLSSQAANGLQDFMNIGCASCHVPVLETDGTELPLRLPEIATDPFANTYLTLDLADESSFFEYNGNGGLLAPLFADLKLHDMGPGLTEEFWALTPDENALFQTARLWGVADSAPYLHDGRATTITDAILAHGGEAQVSRDQFAGMSGIDQDNLLLFLRSLRTPQNPGSTLVDLLNDDEQDDDEQDDGGGGIGHAPETAGQSASGKITTPQADP